MAKYSAMHDSIVDSQLPFYPWSLGRITKVFSSVDRIDRAVELRNLRRPASKISILPIINNCITSAMLKCYLFYYHLIVC